MKKALLIVEDVFEAVIGAFLIAILAELWITNGIAGMVNFWGIVISVVLGYAALIFVLSTVLEIVRGCNLIRRMRNRLKTQW